MKSGKTRMWAWLDAETNQFRHIYPKRICVEACSPDGFKEAIERGEGEVVEVTVSCKTSKTSRPQKLKSPPSIYYMRDNHTFKNLPLDVDRALNVLHIEFNYSGHGMLCSCHPSMKDYFLHATGNWSEFEPEARKWLEKAVKLWPHKATKRKGKAK